MCMVTLPIDALLIIENQNTINNKNFKKFQKFHKISKFKNLFFYLI